MRYDANHGVVMVNAGGMVVTTASGYIIKDDVINVILAQMSGKAGVAAGLTNAKVWCPIDLQLI